MFSGFYDGTQHSLCAQRVRRRCRNMRSRGPACYHSRLFGRFHPTIQDRPAHVRPLGGNFPCGRSPSCPVGLTESLLTRGGSRLMNIMRNITAHSMRISGNRTAAAHAVPADLRQSHGRWRTGKHGATLHSAQHSRKAVSHPPPRLTRLAVSLWSPLAIRPHPFCSKQNYQYEKPFLPLQLTSHDIID